MPFSSEGRWIFYLVEKYQAYSIYAGFSPMEESSVIRLLLARENHPGEDAVHKALAQVVFSLGPHKPHIF